MLQFVVESVLMPAVAPVSVSVLIMIRTNSLNTASMGVADNVCKVA